MGRNALSAAEKGRAAINEGAVAEGSNAADVVAGDLAEISSKYGLARYNRDSVAWAINSRIEAVQEFAGRASYEIGALLLQARAAEQKEGFTALLRSVNMSDRSAQRHMQVAVRLGDNAQAFGKLSLGKLLAIAQEADSDVIAKLASGERVGDLDVDELDRLPREEIKKRLRKIERERDIWKAAAEDADGKAKAKKGALSPEAQARATMCEAVASEALKITSAVKVLDELFAQADAERMLHHVETQESLYGAVLNAHAALAVVMDRWSVAEPPPAEVLSGMAAAQSGTVQ